MSARNPPRSRGNLVYSKPALSHQELVSRMIERGLIIPDVARAERYVRHLGYYRLSPYMIPFQEPGGLHRFDAAVTFDEVLGLYVFDRQLRLLVLDAVERVEVAVRSAMTDVMSAQAGPHWYVEPSIFADERSHRQFLKELGDSNVAQLERPREGARSRILYPSALEHYLTQYGEPDLPPSWLMVESLTLGKLARVYGNLAKRSDQQSIALSIGTNGQLLTSWLRTYTRVRNICAHHGRLWNAGLGVYPKVPTSRSIAWPRSEGAVPQSSLKRLYPALVTLQSVMKTISPQSSWGERLVGLLTEDKQLQCRGIGIPPRWSSDPFWQLCD